MLHLIIYILFEIFKIYINPKINDVDFTSNEKIHILSLPHTEHKRSHESIIQPNFGHFCKAEEKLSKKRSEWGIKPKERAKGTSSHEILAVRRRHKRKEEAKSVLECMMGPTEKAF